MKWPVVKSGRLSFIPIVDRSLRLVKFLLWRLIRLSYYRFLEIQIPGSVRARNPAALYRAVRCLIKNSIVGVITPTIKQSNLTSRVTGLSGWHFMQEQVGWLTTSRPSPSRPKASPSGQSRPSPSRPTRRLQGARVPEQQTREERIWLFSYNPFHSPFNSIVV